MIPQLPRAAAIGALAAIFSAAGALAAPAALPLGPPQLSFAQFGFEEGLSSLSTFDLALDRSGNLWIATQEGLVRFDGARFRTFGTVDGLPAAPVFNVEIDASGAVWAGTLRGLARLEGERFATAHLPGSPVGEAIEALAVDADGALVAGAVGGAYRCGTEGCQRIFETRRGELVAALALDPHTGELWFAGPFGLVRWKDKELERYSEKNGLPSHVTRALLVDRWGWLWIRQPHGLVALDTNEGAIRLEPGVPEAADSSQLFEDSQGTLWATSDRGLFRRDAGRWSKIGADEGLPSDAVTALTEDFEGALWVGTAHDGVARWNGRDRFVRWTRRTGLPSDVVWAVARGRDGTLALGTQSGLALVAPDERTIRTFDRAAGLEGEHVTSLAADADGGYWVGSTGGRLAHVDAAGAITALGRRSGFPADLTVTAIAIGPGDEVWLATSHGLWTGSGPPSRIAFRRVAVPGGPADDPALPPAELFFDLLRTRDGELWAAGRYGLARLRDGAWTRWTARDGLRDDFLLSLDEAGDGGIWIAYREPLGVSELHWAGGAPAWRHYARADGLRHDQATFVRADALGRVWVGTTRGVSVRTANRFVNFGHSDGLAGEDTCSNAFHADRDGTVWIGTPHGALAARISRDALARRPALEARIVSAQLGGVPMSDGAPAITPADRASFEATLAARTFRSPREVEFRYQMSGVDARPIVSTQRNVRYPTLPYGTYRFRVAARLEGEAWGPDAEARFEVQPPWWASVPARFAALLGAALVGLGVDRLRSRRERKARLELEARVEDRTRDLKASREELARKNDELAHLSLTDPLTGLKNRRFAWEMLAEDAARIDREWSAAGEDAEPESRLVFFLLDVDHFKSINDQHGHEIGDEILIEVAERVRNATRLSDVAVRWGGEEFLVIAHDLPRREWAAFARRLREAVARPPYLMSSAVGPVICTASLGYAAYPYDRSANLTWQQVLRLADQALYAVKQCGRNADLGVEPGGQWNGMLPLDLLAAQVANTVHLRWGNVSRFGG